MSEADKRPVDWERIEVEFRAGIASTREIGAKHGVSHTAIQKRAKRDGWNRDLAAKIQAKADALVSKQAVASEVAMETAATERVVVEANAQAIATVRLAHRTDIGRTRNLCLQLLAELESVSKEQLTVELLREALDKFEHPNGDGKVADKAREALYKAISLPTRTGSLKALSDSLKTLVTLEREAWGLKTDGAGEGQKPAIFAVPADAVREAVRELDAEV